MKYETKLLKLFDNGYLTAKKVTENNIPNIYLTILVRNGVIKRVSRGVYTNKETLIDDFLVLQNKSKNAIFSNLTALYLHGFSERIPIKYDITVIKSYKGSLQKDNRVNLFYTKKEFLNLGIIEVTTPYGDNVKVYDLEKTICDIIRNKNKLELEIVNKAIREYFYSKDKNILKLYDYAKKMNIYNKVRKSFEVLKW